MKTIGRKIGAALTFLCLLSHSTLAQPTLPTLPAGHLLDAWPFQTNLTSFFHDAPLSYTNLALTADWNGNGLLLDSTNPATLNYPVISTDGWTNIAFTEGTIEMWFSPDWNTSDGIGNWGTLLEVGTWNTNLSTATGAWGLYISPDGANVCFSAQTNGVATNYLTAPINWYAGDWHQIIVTYSATNSALYLEGVLITNGPGITVIPASGVLSNGFSVGSDGNGTGLLQARGIYNDLVTFDYALDADSISNDYAEMAQYVFPLPSIGAGFGGHFGADDGPSLPGGVGGGGTNSGGGGSPDFNYPSYGPNDFWIEFLPFGTNAFNTNASLATFLVHGTENDITNEFVYQLWATTNLAPPIAWTPVQTFLGTTNTNFTALTIAISNVPATFFEAVNLGSDPTESGLPAWYLLQHGLDPTSLTTGTNLVSNAYLDPMGDGWTYSALFGKNMSPNTFYAPPAPTGFTASWNTNGTISFSWHPAVNLPSTGAGAVTGYTINLGWTNVTLGASVTSYSINANTDPTFNNQLTNALFVPPNTYIPYFLLGSLPTYALQANYQYTNSLWTTAQSPANSKYAINASVVRGPQGQPCVTLSGVVPGVTSLMIYRYDLQDYFPTFSAFLQNQTTFTPTFTNGYISIPVSSFTNGIYTLSTSQLPLDGYYVLFFQAVGSDGVYGPIEGEMEYGNIPFHDGSQQVEQNAALLLRLADASYPFSFGAYSQSVSIYSSPAQYTYPTNFVYAGFYTPDIYDEDQDVIDEFLPFEENYLLRNFVYAPGDTLLSSGFPETGASLLYGNELQITNAPEFLFSTAGYVSGGGTGAISALLATNQTAAVITFSTFNGGGYFNNVGLYLDGLGHTYLTNNARNLYGLSYGSLQYGNSTSNGVVIATLYPGGLFTNFTFAGVLYPQPAQPQFQTVGYYFGQANIDPMPDDATFSTTNATPLMVASVGQPFYASAWAQQGISNGFTNCFAYLQQYFDKAYLADTNGNITTNQTGVLSEYGEFFPSAPGQVFLTTKTNAYSTPGTNAVQVIGLFTDANHDGTINTSFSGPDFTSAARPFRFWVNDDNDSGDTGGNDIPGEGKNGLSGQVNGVRDLVDFFPVYIDIVSLLKAIPTNQLNSYQFILSQDDGAINFAYTSLTTNLPLKYLTDTNAAAALASTTVQTVTSNGVQLLNGFLYNIRDPGQGIILCEASAPTSSPLVLSVLDTDTGNVVAQTQLFLSITGVEQMFRQKNLIWATYPNQRDGPPDRLADSDVPNEPDTDGNNFVFVHGYNDNPSEARGWQAETFKRMYWSGSHAKFYGISWYAYNSQLHFPIIGDVTVNLQTNIVNAFQTAPQLNAFLNSLSGTNTVAAHSLGNMLVLSTLNDCGNTNIHTFFMMDAAVAIEALDGNPANINTNMVHTDWPPYGTNLWASYWRQLFPTNDYRSQLTWSNRLANTQNAQMYNFYSSGEEVLRNWTNGLTPSQLGGVAAELIYQRIANGAPFGAYTWAMQELEKGRMAGNGILSSDHGGWKFNAAYDTNYFFEDGYVTNHLAPSAAAALSNSVLMTNAFFDFTGNNATSDSALLGSGGSAYAQTNRNRILSDAIPVVTQSVGANPVTNLDVEFGESRNFNMQTNFENGWPLQRLQSGEKTNNWYHSDMREVAYTYTFKLFTNMVNFGNLK